MLNEDLHQTMNNDIKERCSIASHLSVLLPDLSMPPIQYLGRYENLVTSFINELAGGAANMVVVVAAIIVVIAVVGAETSGVVHVADVKRL